LIAQGHGKSVQIYLKKNVDHDAAEPEPCQP